MVKFDLDKNAFLSNEERKLLAEAKGRPIIYDNDSPELTDKMEQEFLAARRRKPYRGERLAN